jgi:hypothetical protein
MAAMTGFEGSSVGYSNPEVLLVPGEVGGAPVLEQCWTVGKRENGTPYNNGKIFGELRFSWNEWTHIIPGGAGGWADASTSGRVTITIEINGQTQYEAALDVNDSGGTVTCTGQAHPEQVQASSKTRKYFALTVSTGDVIRVLSSISQESQSNAEVHGAPQSTQSAALARGSLEYTLEIPTDRL